MSPEEEAFIMGPVLDDFYKEGGTIRIFDESDFRTFSFSEIREKLEKLDDELLETTGYGLDAIVLDHANLCKFSGGRAKGTNDGSEINQYISFK